MIEHRIKRRLLLYIYRYKYTYVTCIMMRKIYIWARWWILFLFLLIYFFSYLKSYLSFFSFRLFIHSSLFFLFQSFQIFSKISLVMLFGKLTECTVINQKDSLAFNTSKHSHFWEKYFNMSVNLRSRLKYNIIFFSKRYFVKYNISWIKKIVKLQR